MFVCLYYCFLSSSQHEAVQDFCTYLESVNSYHSYISAAPRNGTAPWMILEGRMAATRSLQAWHSITVTVLPCTQSGLSPNNYCAPQASNLLSWGCVDIDLPQVHYSPFIILLPRRSKRNGHTSLSAVSQSCSTCECVTQLSEITIKAKCYSLPLQGCTRKT